MHYRKLLLVGLLSGISAAATAQAPVNLPSENFKQQLRSQYLRNDTAQAIITLYSKRQAGGASWMVSSALAAARLATAGGSTTSSGLVVQEGPSIGVALLVSAPFMGYGFGKLLHYSNTHLEQQLTAYAAGQPLPRSLRRKLKPRFFNEPIIPYTPVSYTPAK